jgi:hypothetical protein
MLTGAERIAFGEQGGRDACFAQHAAACAGQQQPAETRMHGQCREFPSDRRKLPIIIGRAEQRKQPLRVFDCIDRRRVEPWKAVALAEGE